MSGAGLVDVAEVGVLDGRIALIEKLECSGGTKIYAAALSVAPFAQRPYDLLVGRYFDCLR